MLKFNNAHESHSHSRQILDILYGYDTFLDSLEVVADFGCGSGLDTYWWATLMTRDDPPIPRDYIVYAVDTNAGHLSSSVSSLKNVHFLTEDIETVTLPRTADLVWCHDAFQFITNPLTTLSHWNSIMNENGMLILSIPQMTHYSYNRVQTSSYNYCYYNHTLVSLMYMLAVNGFDCRDAYFKKDDDTHWLHAAVYKSSVPPMRPKETSWYTLADSGLVSDSIIECISKYGYVKQEEVVVAWLDKDFSELK